MNTRNLILGVFLFALYGCKQESVNPYDAIVDVPTVQDTTNFPPGTFPYLYTHIFKPTCSNSGCHDGSFEPDFRSMNSAYNTLVHHPVIANDETNSFDYRVVPGDTSASLLHERLLRFLPNSSGIMPLAVENDSDWPARKTEYITAIKNWIMAGAPDISGNPAPPLNTNQLPMNYGLAVFPPGNSTNQYQRGSPGLIGIGPFVILDGNADVYIYPYDDNAGLFNFETLSWEVSLSATNFQPVLSGEFEPTLVIYAPDFGGNISPFTRHALIDLSDYSGQTVFMRLRINDGVQSADSYIPTADSNPFWYAVYSFQIP
ncbi:MAG: hypothetical protein ACKOZM_00240 [Flavobacteriales bacterium]